MTAFDARVHAVPKLELRWDMQRHEATMFGPAASKGAQGSSPSQCLLHRRTRCHNAEVLEHHPGNIEPASERADARGWLLGSLATATNLRDRPTGHQT